VERDSQRDEAARTRYVYVLTIVAALGGLLFGYDTGVIGGCIGFLAERFALNAAMKGWAASSALVGCIVGAACAGSLSDRLGRRTVLQIAAVLFTISAIGSAVPRTLAELVFARILGGLGVGAASMLSPLYISEVAPARIRGRLVSINQLTIVLGFFVVFCVNAWIERLGNDAWNVAYGWRWMFGSETAPALLFMALLFTVPESPRWLTKQGRGSEALAVLERVVGPEQATADAAEIRDAIAHEEGSVRQLFEPGLRVALVIGLALAVLQQVTGINSILYYGPEVFKSAGFERHTAFLQNVLVGAVNVAFTLVAIATVDKVGRKFLLLVGSAGMGVFLTLLALSFDVEAIGGPWMLVFVLGYIACFALSVGPVVWVIMSEIFPTRIRGRAMAFATVFLWCACYLVSQTFPMLEERLGSGHTFYCYAAMCAVMVLFVWRVLPETKGKTLEEIEQSWQRSNRP